MTMLLTGATGTVGREVLAELASQSVDVRVLTRRPGEVRLPAGAQAVQGDLSDLVSVRRALQGISTLFLLAPNVADELTQAMLTLDAAADAGVKGIVYLSVFRGADYADVPHFIGKATVERMIAARGLAATILQPAYFMQNDLRQQAPLSSAGLYAMPLGHRGVSMIDTRDIGRAAARALLRRELARAPLPAETVPLVGPDALTGESLAAIWADVLNKPVRYAGDDLQALESRLAATGPAWLARDLALMLRRYQADGAVATPADLSATTEALGRAPRSYRAFAQETASAWAAA